MGKLRDILAALDFSSVRDRRAWTCRGFGCNALKGRLKGHSAVSVSGNWRVTFRFEEVEAVDVDYVDYH